MMRSPDKPPPYKMLMEIFRIRFNFQMIYYTAECHNSKLQKQNIQVHGKKNNGYRKYDGLQKALQWMKRKGCPGAGCITVVMNFMQ